MVEAKIVLLNRKGLLPRHLKQKPFLPKIFHPCKYEIGVKCSSVFLMEKCGMCSTSREKKGVISNDP
jgi:hypothetical protein